MEKANVTKTINVSADKAWANLSSFRGIEHISPIARSVVEGEGEGTTRTCYMPDDARIDEALTKVDNETLTMQYIITEGPFPFSDYVSTVKITPKGDNSCEIHWSADYNVSDDAAADMKGLLDGFYVAIIDGLEGLINNQN